MTERPHPATSRANVRTDRPQRYGKQLVTHLSHRHGGEWDVETRSGWVDLATGKATVVATDSELQLRVDATDDGELARLEEVVAQHLIRFGAQDELTVTWER